MSCPSCRSSLGCFADCPTAPWNDGKKNHGKGFKPLPKLVFLLRIQRWKRSLLRLGSSFKAPPLTLDDIVGWLEPTPR